MFLKQFAHLAESSTIQFCAGFQPLPRCPYCGEHFTPRSQDQLACSVICAFNHGAGKSAPARRYANNSRSKEGLKRVYRKHNLYNLLQGV